MSSDRESLANALTSFLRREGLDRPWGPVSSWATHGGDRPLAQRRDYRTRLARSALDSSPVPDEWDGEVLLIAGPPGAGKTHHVQATPYSAWLQVDADDFKDELLADARAAGELDLWLGIELLEHEQVRLRELAGWVQAESSLVADRLREMAAAEGRPMVLHGTFSKAEHLHPMVEGLAAHYERLKIIDVEVDCYTAVERTTRRWEEQRAADPESGGRFVPTSYVESMYKNKEGPSVIREVLADLQRAQSSNWGSFEIETWFGGAQLD